MNLRIKLLKKKKLDMLGYKTIGKWSNPTSKNQKIRNARLISNFVSKPEIEKKVYNNTDHAEGVLQRNKYLNLEISKALNRYRSQCYLDTIREAKEKKDKEMPEIRIQKISKDDDSFSEVPVSGGSKNKHQDVKNVKLISEARKYVPGIDQDIFYWRKIQSHRLMPEVREQFTMAQVDQRLYIFGGLSHDCLGDFLT